MVEIVGRDREKLKELQTLLTGYTSMLGEVIWRSINEAWRTWWLFCCPLLKIVVYSVELMFRTITYDKVNIWLCVMQFEFL